MKYGTDINIFGGPEKFVQVDETGINFIIKSHRSMVIDIILIPCA